MKNPIVNKNPLIDSVGTKNWYDENGDLHREDGPAKEHINGTKSWWIHGKRHREDGPAHESANGSKFWYQNGKLHRLDGPAIERLDDMDKESRSWYFEGRFITNVSQEEFERYLKLKSFW